MLILRTQCPITDSVLCDSYQSHSVELSVDDLKIHLSKYQSTLLDEGGDSLLSRV